MRARFILSEVGIGLRRNLTMTFAVVITVAISLSLLGIGLLLLNLTQARWLANSDQHFVELENVKPWIFKPRKQMLSKNLVVDMEDYQPIIIYTKGAFCLLISFFLNFPIFTKI